MSSKDFSKNINELIIDEGHDEILKLSKGNNFDDLRNHKGKNIGNKSFNDVYKEFTLLKRRR